MTFRRWRVAAILAPVAVTMAVLAAPAAAQAQTLSSSTSVTQQCSEDFNGGTIVNGVCVLPGATVGFQYEAFLALSNFESPDFTVVAGSLPPGLMMPPAYGVTGTIVGGTPTTPGTYTFTVHDPAAPDLTYSITVTG